MITSGKVGNVLLLMGFLVLLSVSLTFGETIPELEKYLNDCYRQGGSKGVCAIKGAFKKEPKRLGDTIEYKAKSEADERSGGYAKKMKEGERGRGAGADNNLFIDVVDEGKEIVEDRGSSENIEEDIGDYKVEKPGEMGGASAALRKGEGLKKTADTASTIYEFLKKEPADISTNEPEDPKSQMPPRNELDEIIREVEEMEKPSVFQSLKEKAKRTATCLFNDCIDGEPVREPENNDDSILHRIKLEELHEKILEDGNRVAEELDRDSLEEKNTPYHKDNPLSSVEVAAEDTTFMKEETGFYDPESWVDNSTEEVIKHAAAENGINPEDGNFADSSQDSPSDIHPSRLVGEKSIFTIQSEAIQKTELFKNAAETEEARLEEEWQAHLNMEEKQKALEESSRLHDGDPSDMNSEIAPAGYTEDDESINDDWVWSYADTPGENNEMAGAKSRESSGNSAIKGDSSVPSSGDDGSIDIYAPPKYKEIGADWNKKVKAFKKGANDRAVQMRQKAVERGKKRQQDDAQYEIVKKKRAAKKQAARAQAARRRAAAVQQQPIRRPQKSVARVQCYMGVCTDPQATSSVKSTAGSGRNACIKANLECHSALNINKMNYARDSQRCNDIYYACIR